MRTVPAPSRRRAYGRQQLRFPATQGDLADSTGLTAVHVNRTLQELRSDGLIELYGRKLTIPDLDGLMKASAFNANYLHFDDEGGLLAANG